MDEETKYKIILRHDTSSNWTINNPILVFGEYGIEDDTHRVKRGDGQTDWINLPYETFGLEEIIEAALSDKFVEKEEGKQLSEENYTFNDKTKLDSLKVLESTSDLINNGDGESPFATEEYVSTLINNSITEALNGSY